MRKDFIVYCRYAIGTPVIQPFMPFQFIIIEAPFVRNSIDKVIETFLYKLMLFHFVSQSHLFLTNELFKQTLSFANNRLLNLPTLYRYLSLFALQTEFKCILNVPCAIS